MRGPGASRCIHLRFNIESTKYFRVLEEALHTINLASLVRFVLHERDHVIYFGQLGVPVSNQDCDKKVILDTTLFIFGEVLKF